jgi:hypothetical protein
MRSGTSATSTPSGVGPRAVEDLESAASTGMSDRT